VADHSVMSQPAPLTLSIVTPSYKQPAWLRLCAASIADQATPGLVIEHIVQDSLSGPEVEEVLKPFPNVKFFSEKDQGMYDAVRRGWDRATGDILCWLNCDEQYLPGALQEVAHYFRDHPEVDLLFGDAIVVDGAGGYLCSRQVMVPQLYHTWTCQLHTLSCATFFRRDLLTRTRGFALDPRWRDAGDGALIVQMLRAGRPGRDFTPLPLDFRRQRGKPGPAPAGHSGTGRTEKPGAALGPGPTPALGLVAPPAPPLPWALSSQAFCLRHLYRNQSESADPF
jgi:glycosyltransferase involved in cell wall biosynthesis